MKRCLIFAVVLLLCPFVRRTADAEAQKPLTDCRVLIVIAPENFRDEEYSEPRQVLENEGARIIVAADSVPEPDEGGKRLLAECKGTQGLKVRPDVTLAEALDAAENGGLVDAVIFVGGPGAAQYAENATALQLARSLKLRRKIVGAICLAPTILANAGMLKDVNATSIDTAKQALEKAGAKFVEKAVVVDGRIVTADGPKSARQFGETIRDMLVKGIESERKARELIAPARALVKDKKLAEAHAALAKVIEENKTDALVASAALLFDAELYQTEGLTDKAVAGLKRIAADFPASDVCPSAVFDSAMMLWKIMNKPDEAAGLFGKLSAIDADDFERGSDGYKNYHFKARVALGEIRIAQEKYIEAIDSFLAASHQQRAAFPNRAAENEAKGACVARIADAAAALLKTKADDEMRQAAASATTEEYLFILGMTYYRGEKLDPAKKVFEIFVKTYPNSKLIGQIPADARPPLEPERPPQG